ncbi:hypothetical protein LU11_gp178 [Pseudomonas phage Lu11]|uniref:hypothetical protein n=1 Tax=Pseudomonas phage Lu11 TaxID=1161927 RepID=UPI00025F17D8|nr:hypothetical protein LU11_gp178 [Pseudomonas phage Lu11]AFH14709.1 hypothetical protein Lu11_0174 [Pseudomonas phage Lu11]
MTAENLRTEVTETVDVATVEIEASLRMLRGAQVKANAAGTGGGREIALAITNIETGLLWLREGAQKI